MTDPMSAINNIIGGIGAPSSAQRWLVCDKCGSITEHDMSTLPPAACPHCTQQTSFKVMPSKGHADALAASFRPAAPKETPTPPNLLRPTPVAPAADPVAPPVALEPPTPIKSAPRTRKRAEPVEQPPVAQAAPVAPTPTEHADPKAAREAAIARLIQTHNLNEIEVKELGQGTVYTLGFTRWTEQDGRRLPVYSFMELTDTPQSFKEELNAARQEDGMIALDVARVTDLTADIFPTTFGGELIASLKNSHGPVLAARGARVKIGAKLSKLGRIVWFVTGVTK